MPGVGLAGIAHLHAADQLVPALAGQPFKRYGLRLQHGLIIGRVVLDRCPDNAGIDDLPLAGPEAVLLQLTLHLGKDPMLDVGLYQTLAKDPDRVAIPALGRRFSTRKNAWKLMRTSSWNSICSSDRLNSCWSTSRRVISSVG